MHVGQSSGGAHRPKPLSRCGPRVALYFGHFCKRPFACVLLDCTEGILVRHRWEVTDVAQARACARTIAGLKPCGAAGNAHRETQYRLAGLIAAPRLRLGKRHSAGCGVAGCPSPFPPTSGARSNSPRSAPGRGALPARASAYRLARRRWAGGAPSDRPAEAGDCRFFGSQV